MKLIGTLQASVQLLFVNCSDVGELPWAPYMWLSPSALLQSTQWSLGWKYLKGGLDARPHDMGHLLCQDSMRWLPRTQLMCDVEQQVHLAIQRPGVL